MAAFSRGWRGLLTGVVVLATWPVAAFAQVAPSQVTPETLRPPAESAPVSLPSAGGAQLQAPPGAEGLSFIIGHVQIEGAFPELESDTRPLVDAIEGRRATVAQVYEFANAVEQAYARAGYVLVRVTVPAQKLNDRGTLRIVVVDGFIESVQVDNVAERVRNLVADRMASLVGRRHIKLGEIERQLLVSGDVPGLQLKSTLAQGETFGGELLVLEGTQKLVTGSLTVDNRMQESLGTWSYGGNAQLNSPFGFGEQVYASVQSAGDPSKFFNTDSPLLVLGGGAIVPLGLGGWMFNPEYTSSRSQPDPGTGGLVNIGYFQRVALRTWYPLILTRSKTLTLNGAFESISQNVFLPLFGTDLNKDQYGVARIGAAYTTALRGPGGSLQSSVTFSQGVGGRDQAEATASGIPLSRQGAGPLFSKIVADAEISGPLPKGFRIDVIGRAQTSFGKPMLTSEQFALDGAQAISAYSSGALGVDEGATLRAELSRPFEMTGFAAPLVLSPYAFGVIAAGILDQPTITEVAAVQAAAAGIGLRSRFDAPDGYHGATVSLELARQFSNLPTLPQGWRGNVSLSARF